MKLDPKTTPIPRPPAEMRRRREAVRVLLKGDIQLVKAYQEIRSAWLASPPKLEAEDFAIAEKIYEKCQQTEDYTPFVAHLTGQPKKHPQEGKAKSGALSRLIFGNQPNLQTAPAAHQKKKLLSTIQCLEFLQQMFTNLKSKTQFEDLSMAELYKRGINEPVVEMIEEELVQRVQNGTVSTVPEESILRKICDTLGVDYKKLAQVDVPPSTNKRAGQPKILNRWQLGEQIIITRHAETSIAEGKDSQMLNTCAMVYACEDARQFSIPLVHERFYVDIVLDKMTLPEEKDLEKRLEEVANLSPEFSATKETEKKKESLEERLARLRAQSKQPV